MTEEILASAIQKEAQSRDFYTRVSEKIVAKKAKKIFDKMAGDEAGHVAILSRQFNKLFNKEYTVVQEALSEKLKIAEAQVYDIQTALQIVSLAIGLEEESIQFYIRQFEKTEDPEEKKMIKKLVHFEMGHKKRLQNQHDRLNKGISWTGR
ncbi:MAG: ferritin family protein [Spirochaetales bacterium]|nr:ferritin family protein [Spirochaetales bacterium]